MCLSPPHWVSAKGQPEVCTTECAQRRDKPRLGLSLYHRHRNNRRRFSQESGEGLGLHPHTHKVYFRDNVELPRRTPGLCTGSLVPQSPCLLTICLGMCSFTCNIGSWPARSLGNPFCPTPPHCPLTTYRYESRCPEATSAGEEIQFAKADGDALAGQVLGSHSRLPGTDGREFNSEL